jgi:hypothetical protein
MAATIYKIYIGKFPEFGYQESPIPTAKRENKREIPRTIPEKILWKIGF